MLKILAMLMLSLISSSVAAKEIVSIVYAFSPSDTMANYGRTLVDEANRIQNRYTFLFETRPGAGNSIAANYVLKTPNTILMSTGAFFVRPNFYPNESYDVKKFRTLMLQCKSSMSVASNKFQSWEEIPSNEKLNIGISGLGVVSHLIATQIVSKYPNAQLVPYKSTSDSLIAVANGQLDLIIGFVREQENWKDSKYKLTILGTTGHSQTKQYLTLISSGFPDLLGEAEQTHHLTVSDIVSQEKFDDWRNILIRAGQAKSVHDSYNSDYCTAIPDMTEKEIQVWYAKQIQQWQKLGSGITLN